jgi:hypothetical protein
VKEQLELHHSRKRLSMPKFENIKDDTDRGNVNHIITEDLEAAWSDRGGGIQEHSQFQEEFFPPSLCT